MNAMSKLHYLFVKHLRTMYAGEKSMADALNVMSMTVEEPHLRKFYKMKAGENITILNALDKVFRAIGVPAEGETDPIIDSFLRSAYSDDAGYNSIYKAIVLNGRAISVYRTNALKTAISSAEDIGMFDVSEILMDCLPLVQFNRRDYEFLKTEFEKRGIEATEFEAA